MERRPRPADMSSIDHLPTLESKMRAIKPLQTSNSLREVKNSPPINRERGLEEYRFMLENAKSQPISAVVDFVDSYIRSEKKRKVLKEAISARDIGAIKNIFSEVAKRKPDIADVIDKINNVILGDNPPWEYLDYFFEEDGDSQNFRTP